MTEEPQYAKFWDRFGAYLLDTLIVGFIVYGINYLNFITIKSFYVYLPNTLAAILYKPYMESTYQATLGKMALNLKVTSQSFEKIDFEKSIIRSLIFIIPSLFYIPFFYVGFNEPSLISTDGLWDFSIKVVETYPVMTTFNTLFSIIYIVDVIILLADDSKRQRSLKDRMAKTYVIMN